MPLLQSWVVVFYCCVMLRFLFKWNLLLSPVYYIPGLPVYFGYGIRYTMFLTLLILSVFRYYRVHQGVLRLILLLFLTVIPSLFLDLTENAIVLFHYTALFCLLGLSSFTLAFRITSKDLVVLLALYSLPLLCFLGVFDVEGPLEKEGIPFFVSGLTFKATSWSNSLALMVGLLLFKLEKKNWFITTFLILVLLISQIIAGGRMGFLMSLFIVIYHLRVRWLGTVLIPSMMGVGL